MWFVVKVWGNEMWSFKRDLIEVFLVEAETEEEAKQIATDKAYMDEIFDIEVISENDSNDKHFRIYV